MEKPERTEKTDRSDKTEKAEKSDRPEKSEKTEKADRTEKTARTEKPETEGKVRFTLQLSSFQDKSEAEAFLATTKAAGFQPYLTEADVSGKGMFYRVRLGSYRSLEAANDAKAEYEKSAKKTAQVMRL
jgi:cell division septation protein DedD